MRTSPRLAAVPAELDLVAYRLVQEALTNAIRYAGHARACVTVSVGATGLELQITDTGGSSRPSSPAVVNGSGHGLIGMAERVELHGGELRAGPRAPPPPERRQGDPGGDDHIQRQGPTAVMGLHHRRLEHHQDGARQHRVEPR